MENLNLKEKTCPFANKSVIVGRTGIEKDVLECIGSTPLIRVSNIIKKENLKCDLLVKCEFFNAGGSVKDRIAKRMIEKAEEEGKITRGYTTIIEPTSGNTGTGLALACAIKGYRCIIVMPEKMSLEKVRVLKALGAEIVRTRTSAAFDDDDSHISIARKLERDIPGAWIPDQYINCNNPDAHYFGTGAEIWEQTRGKIDVLVAGAGTGGTITGIAKILKKHNPSLRVVGVDPYGSILAQPEGLNKSEVTGYEVEGIGYDFIPDVCKREFVDEWRKCNDEQSLPMARRLIKEEGLLCGGSSGSSFYHALEIAKTMPEGTRVVCILPDSIRNYMTKHLMDEWMYERDLMIPDLPAQNKKWYNSQVISMAEKMMDATLNKDSKVNESLEKMKSLNTTTLPIIGETGIICGIFSQTNCLEKILSGEISLESKVSECLESTFRHVDSNDTVGKAARIIQNNGYVFVVDNGKYGCTLHRNDIFEFISKN